MIIPEDAPQGLCPKCLLTEASTATEMSGATNTSEIPSLERVRAAFPNLEIIELIGRGGMGFVFKARQPNLDRFVALKLLPEKPSGLTSSIAILYAAFVISLSILVIVAVAKWVNRKKLSRETISFAIIIPIAITTAR